MKKNTIIKVGISVIVLVLIAAGIWFIVKPDKGAVSHLPQSPNGTSSIAPMDSSSPTTAAPIMTAPPTMTYDEYKASTNDFSGVKEVSGFSKEDVTAVLTTAQTYAEAALSDKYFLSGKWALDGYNTHTLDVVMGQYYTEPLREKIRTFKSVNDLMPITYYVSPENPGAQPSPLCAVPEHGTDGKPVESKEGVNSFSCPLDGVNISDMKYKPGVNSNGDSVLSVDFTSTAKIPVMIDQTIPAFTEVTYTYLLDFVKNPYYDEATDPQKFVISNYDTTTVSKKVQAVG